MKWLPVLVSLVLFLQLHVSIAATGRRCLGMITRRDSLLIAAPNGRILSVKNGNEPRIPASTIKVLTSLAALDRLGRFYRFRTEFYRDKSDNLLVKGFGDPLLTSEVLEDMALSISMRIHRFRSLILDNTYFAPGLRIPGCGGSTNPYDAPVGALCANFNTAFFRRDRKGKIVSAERQTPMVPFVRERVKLLGLRAGRHTIIRDSREGARHFGELFLHFLRQAGVKGDGTISIEPVKPGDTLIHTYESILPLEDVVQKMLKSSSNFMANQIFITLGAVLHGPPGTLAKGVGAVMDYAKNVLGLKEVRVVEGSGISRKNRISALEMFTVLKRFRSYRHLLRTKGALLYKTGSLKGVRTEVGYVEVEPYRAYPFVLFFNRPHPPIKAAVECVKRAVAGLGGGG